MDFVIYFIGPIAALALPTIPLLAALVLGWGTGKGDLTLLVPLVVIPALVAVSLPAESSFQGWPAPWWMAAMAGPYKLLGTIAVWIGGLSLAAFVIAASIAYARRS
jgi:hypothetical protein